MLRERVVVLCLPRTFWCVAYREAMAARVLVARPIRYRQPGGRGRRAACAQVGHAELRCIAIVPLDGFGDKTSFTLLSVFFFTLGLLARYRRWTTL